MVCLSTARIASYRLHMLIHLVRLGDGKRSENERLNVAGRIASMHLFIELAKSGARLLATCRKAGQRRNVFY